MKRASRLLDLLADNNLSKTFLKLRIHFEPRSSGQASFTRVHRSLAIYFEIPETSILWAKPRDTTVEVSMAADLTVRILALFYARNQELHRCFAPIGMLTNIEVCSSSRERLSKIIKRLIATEHTRRRNLRRAISGRTGRRDSVPSKSPDGSRELQELDESIDDLEEFLCSFLPAPSAQAPSWEAIDLTIVVRYIRTPLGVTLKFGVADESGNLDETYQDIFLTSEPATFFSEVLTGLGQAFHSENRSPGAIPRRLQGIGGYMFDELLPARLQARLTRVIYSRRDPNRGWPIVHIISDECAIPWELLWIRNPSARNSGYHLAESATLTRWLRNFEVTTEFPLTNIGVVATLDSSSEEDESRFIKSLKTKSRTVTELPSKYEAIVDHLAGVRYDGLHFIGHGSIRPQNSILWAFVLPDGEKFGALDLMSDSRPIGRARPLVFLNACHLARGKMALTTMGGLPRAFIAAGAGAFVGASFAVPGRVASYFAKMFYNSVLRGETLGEAGRTARGKVRAAFEGDPAWLAYTVFAHPQARHRYL